MRYQAVWTVGRGETPDAIASDLRAYAFGANISGSNVAAECRVHGVKHRVAKRWSTRAICTRIPRSRRIRGAR